MGNTISSHLFSLNKKDQNNFDSLKNKIDCITKGHYQLNVFGKDIIENKTQDFVDPLRAIKDLCTDIVVEEFFVTDESLYRFMETVYGVHDEILKYYKSIKDLDEWDVFFIYKGGNILKFVSTEFLLELPHATVKEFEKFYKPYFKRSDADYAIYINSSIDDYEIVYKELSIIAYEIQKYLKNLFETNLEYFFDYPKYKSCYKSDILFKHLQKFKELEDRNIDNIALGNTRAEFKDNFKYQNRDDIFVKFTDDEESKSLLNYVQKNECYFYNSFNTALHFGRENFNIRFNLIRTKINFTLQEESDYGPSTLNIGGELIDVSLAHKSDFKEEGFWKNVKSNVKVYTLENKHGSTQFLSYSVRYLIQDLETILFKQSEIPWQDCKYVKRLNRLFYFYFIDIFVTINSGNKRIALLKDYRTLVLDTYREDKSRLNITKFQNKYPEISNLGIGTLIKYLDGVKKKVKTKDDKEQFKSMIDIIVVNDDFVLQTLENIKKYCSRDGIIKKSSIYSAETKDIL